MNKAVVISHSLQAWSNALGVKPNTLETRLVNVGHPPEKNGALIHASFVFDAMLGDETAERIRNLRADADRKEREEAIAKGEVVTMADVEKLLTEYFIAPLSNALNSAASSLDTRANPTDPECARVAISAWVEEVKKILRDGLPKQKGKE